MLSPSWLMGELECGSAAPPSPFVISVRDRDGRLLGAAPWCLTTDRFGWRVVRFLGSGRICGDHLSLLTHPGCEELVASETAARLIASRSHWDELDLRGVDHDDRTMRQFAERLELEERLLTTVRRDTGTWAIDLPAGWEEYRAQLGSSRCKRIRKWQRDYFESGRARLHLAESPEELDHQFELLARMHNRRRRSLGESGVFEQPDFLAFHRCVSPKLFREGLLRPALLVLDGVPAAAAYLLQAEQTWFAYQSGIEPDLARHGPGRLLLLALLRNALETGCRRFDFLRGNEEYKASWGARPHGMVRIRSRHNSLLGGVLHFAEQLRTIARGTANP